MITLSLLNPNLYNKTLDQDDLGVGVFITMIMTDQWFSYYPEVTQGGDNSRAIICEVIYLLDNGQGINWQYLRDKLKVSAKQVSNALNRAKGVWLDWTNGNGNRRHSFRLLKSPTKNPFQYQLIDLARTHGNHQQAACNQFLNIACKRSIPPSYRIAKVLGCSSSTADKLKAGYYKSYPQATTTPHPKVEQLPPKTGATPHPELGQLISNDLEVTTFNNKQEKGRGGNAVLDAINSHDIYDQDPRAKTG